MAYARVMQSVSVIFLPLQPDPSQWTAAMAGAGTISPMTAVTAATSNRIARCRFIQFSP